MEHAPAAIEQPYRASLKRDDPVIRLASIVLDTELGSFNRHLPRAGEAPDPEQTHQLRVAARRLRVAQRLFHRYLPKDSLTLSSDLKWFGRLLGEARDLDVYSDLLRTEEAANRHLTQAAKALRQRNDEARAAARAYLARALQSDRFRDFHSRLGEFVASISATKKRGGKSSHSIVEGASDSLKKEVYRLRKLGHRVHPASDPAALHKVRIRSKRVRYEIEWFIAFFPELAELAAAARQMQTTLGMHRDASMAAERVRGRALEEGDGNPSILHELTLLAWSQEDRASRLRKDFEDDWNRFEKALRKTKLSF